MTFTPAPPSLLVPLLGSAAALTLPLSSGMLIVQQMPDLTLVERYGVFGLFSVSLIYAFVTIRQLGLAYAKGQSDLNTSVQKLDTSVQLLRTTIDQLRSDDTKERNVAVNEIKQHFTAAVNEIRASRPA
jgi:hypothetical protein